MVTSERPLDPDSRSDREQGGCPCDRHHQNGQSAFPEPGARRAGALFQSGHLDGVRPTIEATTPIGVTNPPVPDWVVSHGLLPCFGPPYQTYIWYAGNATPRPTPPDPTIPHPSPPHPAQPRVARSPTKANGVTWSNLFFTSPRSSRSDQHQSGENASQCFVLALHSFAT